MLFSFDTLPLALRSLQGEGTPTGLGPCKKNSAVCVVAVKMTFEYGPWLEFIILILL